MARRVLLSARAQKWLHCEVANLAERSAPAARRLLERIKDARQLATFPRSGRPGLVPGTRRLVLGRYVLTYRRRGTDDLEIIDIRHGRQAETSDL